MLELQNDSFALLIGVDDYTTYDPAQNLPGSVNDVNVLWRVCLALDVRPDHVRVLITRSKDASSAALESPPSESFAGAESVAEATRENILAGAAWLAKNLAGGRIPGLLSYSGHGDLTSTNELALCPTDVQKSGDDVENLVSYAELGEILARGGASESLTVVLDCCHAGGADTRGRLGDSKRLSLRGKRVPPSVVRPQLGARMLCAAGVDQIAYQADFTGRFHGAFTWALAATLLQWRPVSEDGAVRLTVSYGEAISVAQELLGALDFTQTPTLSPPKIAALPVLHPRDVVTPGETTSRPDGTRVGTQLDPNYFYSIYFSNDLTAPIAQIVVPNANATVYLQWGTGTTPPVGQVGGASTPATEYWFLTGNQVRLSYISSATQLLIVQQPIPADTREHRLVMNPNTANTAAFTSASAVTWQTNLQPPTSGANTTNTIFTCSAIGSPSGATAYVLFNVTSTGGTYTLAAVYWYLAVTSAPTGIQPGTTSGASYSVTTSLPASYYAAPSLSPAR